MNFEFARLRLAAVAVLVCLAHPAFSNDLTISGTPMGIVSVGEPYIFSPQATSVGPLPVQFEIQNAPAWASFQAFSGGLSGTPSASDAGAYPEITISLTDGQSRVDLPTFSIVVIAADGSENQVLTWIPPTTNEDGTPLTDLVSYYIYAGPTADDLVAIELANAGTSRIVLPDLGVGPHFIAVTALNAEGIESTKSAIVMQPAGILLQPQD